MRTRIDIETKTFVRFWLVVIGFVVAFAVINAAQQALIILGIAFFLALALNRPVSMLANLLPGKSRVGATAIAYIAVLALLGTFFFLVIPPIIEQTAKVAGSIPHVIDQAQTQWQGLTNVAKHYGMETQLNQALDSVKDNASSWAANWATNVGANIVSSVGSLFGFLTAAFLVLVLTFLMLIEAPRVLAFIWSAYPDRKKMEHHKRLASKMYHAVTGYVTGQLTVSGIGAFFAGVTVFILSWIFNVPHNIALPSAAIAFVLSLIPMFGATIGGALICLLLAFNDVTAALIFAVYFIIYQQIENNFISPTIQARTVRLSALAILSSVTIGLYLFGIVGGIISIPIAGCIKVLVEDYMERSKDQRAEKTPHQLAAKEA